MFRPLSTWQSSQGGHTQYDNFIFLSYRSCFDKLSMTYKIVSEIVTLIHSELGRRTKCDKNNGSLSLSFVSLSLSKTDRHYFKLSKISLTLIKFVSISFFFIFSFSTTSAAALLTNFSLDNFLSIPISTPSSREISF